MNIVQPPLPGTCRADKKARPPRLPEKSLQAHIRQALGLLGYASAEIGASRKYLKCPACGNPKVPPAIDATHGNMGNSIGTPDLLVWLNTDQPDKFPPVGIMLEVKAEGGKATPEQQLLLDRGRSQIVRSVGEAVRAVKDAEDRMSGYKPSPAKREQIEQFLKHSGNR